MVRGEEVFIQDLRFPGMVHATVVRPPNYYSRLISVDEKQLKKKVPGILKVIRMEIFWPLWQMKNIRH
jgi:CO/xanthine dehydrogenase Mo-binding subunit